MTNQCTSEKLLYYYCMFQHYCVIVRELVVNTLVHTGPARRQHLHTDHIYSRHAGLHENYNSQVILAILV